MTIRREGRTVGPFTIDINNFQSISNASLTFEPGINVIVGQSNSGKTAILRAINAVITNPSRAKYYIKKGTNKTIVSIDYDHNRYEWSRAPKESLYDLNGDVYEKIGNKTIFDLVDNCAFVRDDSGNVMNIEGEWDLPFPFDRTPSELFKLFENIFCVSDSALILKSYKDEEAELVKQRSKHQERLIRLQDKLDSINELKEEVDLDLIQSKQDIFIADTDKYFNLVDDVKAIERCSLLSNFRLDEIAPPTTNSLSDYVELSKDLNFLYSVVTKKKFYKTLPETVQVGDTLNKYIALAEDYKVLSKAFEVSQINLDKECNISGDTLNRYLEMNEDLEEIEKSYKAEQFDLSKEYLGSYSIDKYEDLLEDLKYVMVCFKKRKALKEKYDNLELHISDLQAQLEAYKVCPLCGHALVGEER